MLASDREHCQVDFGVKVHVGLVLLLEAHAGELVADIGKGPGSEDHLNADVVESPADLLFAARVGAAHGEGGSCSAWRRFCS